LHPINISRLEGTIDDLNLITENIVNNKSAQPALTNILNFKIKNLNNNFKMIRTSNKRSKRWDSLGRAWKWLAGSPDAEDLRIINSTLNSLINDDSEQIVVNQQIDNKLLVMTHKMNEMIAASNIQLNTTIEMESVKIIINIDTVNGMLETIQDAIINSKASLPHSRVLEVDEILKIKTLLNNQGIEVTRLEDVFDYTAAKVTANKDTLLYILEVPQMAGSATSLHVSSLPVKGAKIVNNPGHLIKFQDQLFTTKKPLEAVQLAVDVEDFEDTCIKPLVFGRRATCTVANDNYPAIHYIADGVLVATNMVDSNLTNNCGPENRQITGNFLLSFENCSITINKNVFTSLKVSNPQRDWASAFYDLEIVKKPLELHNVESLKEEALKLRKQVAVNSNLLNTWTPIILSKTTLLLVAIVWLITRRKRNQQLAINIQAQPVQPWQRWFRSAQMSTEDGCQTSAGGVMNA
jgi:hypothetical protein